MDINNLDACSRVDTISELPDELLVCILSFVPTKLAASTSLLSKRWRDVFRSVDTLDIDDSGSGEDDHKQVFPEGFKTFVDQKVALKFDKPIKKFSLRCNLGADYECEKNTCVRLWISNVVDQCGLLELDLRIRDRRVYALPPQLFVSKTLVKLALGTHLHLGKLPSYVFLPSLKTLLIDSVWFEFGDFHELFLPGCIVLEELSIHHSSFAGTRMIISSPTIKRILVHRSNSKSKISSSSYMSFGTPNLTYLEYSGYALSNYPECNLLSLVEARLDLKKFGWPDVTDLLMGISNVRTLHLSPDSVDVIPLCCNGLPKFDNLVNLSFGSHKKPGWKLLAYLLEQSRKLETLIIQGLRDYEYALSLPQNQVKVLRILSYEDELRHLENIVEKLEFLELVEVQVKDYHKILETKGDLMMLPIVSSSKFKIQVL